MRVASVVFFIKIFSRKIEHFFIDQFTGLLTENYGLVPFFESRGTKVQHSAERKTMDNYSRATQEVSKCFNEQDCFLHRIPVELFQMMKGIFEEETLKAETVGYRYQKQLLEWSGTPGNKQMVLFYKATRDGFTLKDFQLKCYGKGKAWVIISDVKGNVFGGYTSIGWKGSYARVEDPASYVYTLVNPHGIPPTKYNPQENSLCIRDYGNIHFGRDLYIVENSNSNNESYTNFPSYYIDTTGKGNTTFTGDLYFQIKEIEVWGTIAI